MASVASGEVIPTIGGLVLTYLDTGSYGTIVSRTLNVLDANGNLVAGPINMGTNLSTEINITFDQWLQFICVVVDNTGTFTATVDYLAEGIYTQAFLNQMVSLGCQCQRNAFCDLFKAELSFVSAERYAVSGLGIPASQLILGANIYVNSF